MDSLTQVVLGASVGEAVLGKKIGIKAAIFGAIAGTIPDLDTLASPFLDTVGELTFHRSVTHSFLFCFLAAPIFGYLCHKIFGKQKDTFKEWTLLFFLGFITHSLLDTCTTWGTQLMWPFTPYGFATYTVFVVDPHYTLPFMVLLIIALCKPKDSKIRQQLNYIGLGISTAYLLLGFVLQNKANNVFETNLKEQGITYQNYITKPTPLNIWLWATSVQTDSSYYTGFYSVFDQDKKVTFSVTPKNHQLLDKLPPSTKTDKLLYVTKGFYTVENHGNSIWINDLRFGTFDGWQGKGKGRTVFVYHLTPQKDGSIDYEQKSYRFKPSKEYMVAYLKRVFGHKENVVL
ncbi:metal-dependent hydrolase [Flammeovirga kamogawensis]|uniref:Metal-dependent hydrolase n=1 Tax=Flammeovirga kamogawensis TaxID=373891 RepID=A0ABX8H105_9BACT|nr:metal-dependent hydrolase [Flammeovirga kamogawensis]MBB6459521.1 inner membrane protein [Flammeovirga kamogawensis]QWG09072.1 metal-dependent hydrolase [Flammeovirga kamogawensis]TRX67360.1 metal-dependent hydrolase [Flammeovirga kamogawensis]